ncbi:AAA family ATPase [Streptomyces sp. MAR4 CNX-425]|uniref:AAA family ATPase n=1 Tax=Streptomyces sp. MAR4 CNX-425 TaxID=3406343 RepID=UPI003B501FF5
MTVRIQAAIADPDAARATVSLLHQLPDAEAAAPIGDSVALLDHLATLAGAGVAELPEVLLVHERIGPVPALELIRDVALRFPAVGTVLVTADTSPAGYSAAMDAGARGVVGLPLAYEELAARVQAAAQWSGGVRRHLGAATGPEAFGGPGGTLVTVSGAKGGVGATVAAVQLALAARAAGRHVALADLDLQSGDIASYLDVQFRRSVADLAGIKDISPRVLQDAVFTHHTGLGLLLAPSEGERGEDVDDRAARQTLSALRSRYDVVVLDCGSQVTTPNAAAVELADVALLVTTPDVISVRGAKRMLRLWDRLQIRKAEDTVVLVNRLTRHTEIQPSIIARATGTTVARTAVPAAFKELQPLVDAGRLQDLEQKSTVRQALWAVAGELGLTATPDPAGAAGGPGGPGAPGAGAQRALGAGAADGRGGLPAPQVAPPGDRPALPPGPPGTPGPAPGPAPGHAPGRGRRWGDRGQVSVEFAGMLPLIALVLVVVWQFVLVGYTYSLAGNAADMAARAAAVGDDPVAAAEEDLPDAWDASVSVSSSNGVTTATVDLKVPVLFPGGVDFPFTVSGTAGATDEGD